jgi:hypothetical protein
VCGFECIMLVLCDECCECARACVNCFQPCALLSCWEVSSTKSGDRGGCKWLTVFNSCPAISYRRAGTFVR